MCEDERIRFFLVCVYVCVRERCLCVGCVYASITPAGPTAPMGLSGQHCSICGG